MQCRLQKAAMQAASGIAAFCNLQAVGASAITTDHKPEGLATRHPNETSGNSGTHILHWSTHSCQCSSNACAVIRSEASCCVDSTATTKSGSETKPAEAAELTMAHHTTFAVWQAWGVAQQPNSTTLVTLRVATNTQECRHGRNAAQQATLLVL